MSESETHHARSVPDVAPPPEFDPTRSKHRREVRLAGLEPLLTAVERGPLAESDAVELIVGAAPGLGVSREELSRYAQDALQSWQKPGNEYLVRQDDGLLHLTENGSSLLKRRRDEQAEAEKRSGKKS